MDSLCKRIVDCIKNKSGHLSGIILKIEILLIANKNILLKKNTICFITLYLMFG